MNCGELTATAIQELPAWGGLAIAVYATIRALPNELDRWRAQKRDEQRAQAAAKALVAIHRFVNAINHVANPLYTEQRPPARSAGSERQDRELRQFKATQFNAWYGSRWSDIKAELNYFLEIWPTAETFLDEDVDRIFSDLWNLRSQMMASGQLYESYILDPESSAEALAKARDGAFGPAVQSKSSILLAAAKAKLKPIIQFDHKTP